MAANASWSRRVAAVKFRSKYEDRQSGLLVDSGLIDARVTRYTERKRLLRSIVPPDVLELVERSWSTAWENFGAFAAEHPPREFKPFVVTRDKSRIPSLSHAAEQCASFAGGLDALHAAIRKFNEPLKGSRQPVVYLCAGEGGLFEALLGAPSKGLLYTIDTVAPRPLWATGGHFRTIDEAVAAVPALRGAILVCAWPPPVTQCTVHNVETVIRHAVDVMAPSRCCFVYGLDGSSAGEYDIAYLWNGTAVSIVHKHRADYPFPPGCRLSDDYNVTSLACSSLLLPDESRESAVTMAITMGVRVPEGERGTDLIEVILDTTPAKNFTLDDQAE